MISNPIYAGRTDDAGGPRPPRIAGRRAAAAGAWGVDAAVRAQGAVAPGAPLVFTYAIEAPVSGGAFVAFATREVAGLADHQALVFTAHADRPMRLSVQIRAPRGGRLDRWRRSVYLDETPREVVVVFDEMRAAPGVAERRPPLRDVDAVLFVIDAAHTAAGRHGRVVVDEMAYVRIAAPD